MKNLKPQSINSPQNRIESFKQSILSSHFKDINDRQKILNIKTTLNNFEIDKTPNS